MTTITPELVSAITALVAILLSPVISIYVVRRQFGAEVLSHSRQEWINTLRHELSEVLAMAIYIPYLRSIGRGNTDEHLLKYHELYLHHSKIRLLINPDEDDHVDLVASLDRLLCTTTGTSTPDIEVIKAEINDVVAQSQRILKREWSRVKKGV